MPPPRGRGGHARGLARGGMHCGVRTQPTEWRCAQVSRHSTSGHHVADTPLEGSAFPISPLDSTIDMQLGLSYKQLRTTAV